MSPTSRGEETQTVEVSWRRTSWSPGGQTAEAHAAADARADNQEVAADGAAQGSSDDAPGSSDDGPHEVCAETAMLGPEPASLTEKCDPRHGKYVACCFRYREDRSPTGLK